MLYYFKRERKTPSFLGVHNSLPSHKESVKATAGIALIVQGERREGRERRERGERGVREEREEREEREKCLPSSSSIYKRWPLRPVTCLRKRDFQFMTYQLLIVPPLPAGLPDLTVLRTNA